MGNIAKIEIYNGSIRGIYLQKVGARIVKIGRKYTHLEIDRKMLYRNPDGKEEMIRASDSKTADVGMLQRRLREVGWHDD